jgi:Tfp pilus assembly protein PilN
MADLNTTVNRARAAGAASVGFPWRLLVISFVIFGLTVLVWAGIQFGYTPFLNSQLSSATANFNALSGKISERQQKDLTSFYSQLYNIQSLQASHIYSAKLFDFLEKNIYPNVVLNSFQASLPGGSIRFDGVAADYQTLTNELAILKSDPNVTLVSLDSSNQRDVKGGGGVAFTISVSLSPSLFSAAQ